MILYPSIFMMVEGTGSLSISRAPHWSMCKKFEFPRTAKISCSQTQEKTSLRLVCFFPLKIPVGLKKGHARSQQNLQLANGKRQMSLREFVSQARAQEISSGKKSACQFPAISVRHGATIRPIMPIFNRKTINNTLHSIFGCA